jgi:hypothetical protein
MAIVTSAQKSALQSVFVAYFNRPAEPDGLKFYEKVISDRLDKGDKFQDILDTIAVNFAKSPEAQADYPFLKSPTTESAETFLLAVYKNAFNRTESTTSDGFKFWIGRLEDKANPLEPGLALLKIMAGAEAGGDDRKILDNKTEVAKNYSAKAEAAGTAFTYDDAAKAAAKTMIASVDGTAASVVAANTEVDKLITGKDSEAEAEKAAYIAAKTAADTAAATAKTSADAATKAQADADTAQAAVTNAATAAAYKTAADAAKAAADKAVTDATASQTAAAAAVAAAAKTTVTTDDTEAATLKTAADKAVTDATAAQTTAAAEVVSATAAVTANPVSTTGVTINLSSDTIKVSPTNADPATKSTANDDTINAAAGKFTSNTDVDGAGGTDSLNAINTSAGTVTPTLANVEKVFVTQSTNTGTVDFSKTTGATEIWNKASTAPINFTEIGIGTKLGIDTSNATTTFDFKNSDVGGASDSATLVLKNSTVSVGIDLGIEKVNLEVMTKSEVGLGGGYKEVVVKGSADLQINTQTTVEIFDASALNGSVTNSRIDSTGGVTFTGSKLADTLTFLNNAATDTIVFNTSNTSTTSLRDIYANFDSSSEDKIDVSAYGITVGKTNITTFTSIPTEGGPFGGNAVAKLGANTVYVDTNSDGKYNAATDLVFEITGSTANLDVTDFIF